MDGANEQFYNTEDFGEMLMISVRDECFSGLKEQKDLLLAQVVDTRI